MNHRKHIRHRSSCRILPYSQTVFRALQLARIIAKSDGTRRGRRGGGDAQYDIVGYAFFYHLQLHIFSYRWSRTHKSPRLTPRSREKIIPRMRPANLGFVAFSSILSI